MIHVGCEVFSYMHVWGSTSNMIFILNLCFAHSTTHVGSAVADLSSWGNWKGDSKVVHPISSAAGASFLLLVHDHVNNTIKSKQTSSP